MWGTTLRRLRSPAAWSETVDLFAILTAASLPWSTSLAAIFNVAMLVCMVPFSRRQGLPAVAEATDLRAADRAVLCSHCSARCGRGRPGARRFYAVNPTTKLLVLPVLIYHFERSSRGHLVFIAFLVSCAVLSLMSWLVFFPSHALAEAA